MGTAGEFASPPCPARGIYLRGASIALAPSWVGGVLAAPQGSAGCLAARRVQWMTVSDDYFHQRGKSGELGRWHSSWGWAG